MRFGLTLMITEKTVPVDVAAREAEARGFESLWLGEHTHLPVETVLHYESRATREDGRDNSVPEFYKLCPDPYVLLTAAAAATTTLRIGTCIALPAEHSPLPLAKTIATLDRVSGGRFEFGVGYGWNKLEMRNNGVDPHLIRTTLREKVQAMKALWTQDEASFDGKVVQFTASWSWPKPVQSPHPPILLGAAATERNFDEIVAWADGWLPVMPLGADSLEADLSMLRARATAAGRDPSELDVTVLDPRGSMSGKRSRESFERSLPDEASIARCVELGLHRVNFGVPVHDNDFMLWALDALVARCQAAISAGG